MPSAGLFTTSTGEAEFFSNSEGVTTIRCANSDSSDSIDINIPGLHTPGEFYRLAPQGTGTSHIAEFTIAPLGIKSATCKATANTPILHFGVVTVDSRS